ncbi:hypothetical protein UPYG_G00008080 [Umbra pygmaea]|uniref:Uncharacterized protein n=1 Tax=Umbra pygmaea TaxID=75934 RepID=A0ABD0Y723_UMBPY
MGKWAWLNIRSRKMTSLRMRKRLHETPSLVLFTVIGIILFLSIVAVLFSSWLYQFSYSNCTLIEERRLVKFSTTLQIEILL